MRVGWLAWVVGAVHILLLLVHCSRCDSRAAILAVGRVLLHRALGLECRSHAAAAAHVLLVRAGVVHLRGLSRHLLVVLVLGSAEAATASTTVLRVATVHVCAAHIAVR